MPEPTDVLSTDSGTAARNSAEEVNGRSSSSSDQSEMDSWLLEFIDKQRRRKTNRPHLHGGQLEDFWISQVKTGRFESRLSG